jgi:ATP-dependent DNA ligase
MLFRLATSSRCLSQLVSKLPTGEQWQYEVKRDGYRGVAVIQDGKARLWSRNVLQNAHQTEIILDRSLKRSPKYHLEGGIR